MAYDFVNQALSGKPTVQAQPTAQQPVQQRQVSTPVSMQRSTQPVHGKIFSGGILSKTFDALRLPEYAIASFNKGQENEVQKMKSEGKKLNLSSLARGVTAGVKNIIPGVSNRTQFGREEGDYNAGQYISKDPVAQTGINFGLSLVSPTLPVGKIASVGTKLAPKIPGATKVGSAIAKGTSKVVDYARSNPTIAKNVEKLPGLEHFRNPEAGKIIKDATETATVRISKLYNDIADTAKGLTKNERIQIGNIIEGGISSNSKLVTRANYIREMSDRIGQEVVDSGLMSAESFAKFKGKYLSHIADVVKQDQTRGSSKKMLSFTSDSLKHRTGKLGSEGYPDYIKEFQFPTFKALSGEIQNVESVKAVRQLVDKFGKPLTTTTRKALKSGELIKPPLLGPRTTKTGEVLLADILPGNVGKQFKGVAVPQEVADYITKKYSRSDPHILGKIADMALNAWKLGKTVYSGPAYHVRNLISNQILSEMSTGEGLAKTALGYRKAVAAYNGKGDSKMMQYLQELKDAGSINRVNISEGIESLKPGVFDQGQNWLSKIVNSPKKFQQASEATAKLNVYRFWRDNGLDIKEAVKKAEEAIFSPYNINQAEKGIAKHITPFYSFTRQAVPFTAKVLAKNAGRVTKYEKAKTAVEGLSPEGSNEKLPESMEGQVRLPIKDKNGKYIYADPRYTLPYGNFDQPGFGLSVNPFISEAVQSGMGGLIGEGANKDFYFDSPIAKSSIPERRKVQLQQHAFRAMLPNILPSDFVGGIPSGQPGLKYKTTGGSKLYDAFTGQPDYAGRTRSRVQAIFDTFGLKSSSVSPDQPKFDASARSKAIKAIQTERRTILKDQRLKPAEKQELMKQLNEAQRELFTP